MAKRSNKAYMAGPRWNSAAENNWTYIDYYQRLIGFERL